MITPPLIKARPGLLTLSGATLTLTVPTSLIPCEVYLWFRRDGTVDREYSSGGVTQLSSTTDWINPDYQHAAVGDGYEVRYVDSPTTAFDSDPAVGVNNWVDISTDRKFGYTRSSVGSDDSGGFITFELRRANASAAQATGEYSFHAEVITI